MKWFQKAFIVIGFLFSATMVSVVVIAYSRPSGVRKLDVVTMQELRTRVKHPHQTNN